MVDVFVLIQIRILCAALTLSRALDFIPLKLFTLWNIFNVKTRSPNGNHRNRRAETSKKTKKILARKKGKKDVAIQGSVQSPGRGFKALRVDLVECK